MTINPTFTIIVEVGFFLRIVNSICQSDVGKLIQKAVGGSTCDQA